MFMETEVLLGNFRGFGAEEGETHMKEGTNRRKNLSPKERKEKGSGEIPIKPQKVGACGKPKRGPAPGPCHGCL